MNDDERARVLRMVSEGKLSPEEAADLLEAMQPAREEAAEVFPNLNPVRVRGRGSRGRPGVLVVMIKEGGESKVNVRIPLALTRAAGKWLPGQLQNHLSKYDINLNEFLDQIADTDGGTLLEIKDGDSKVLIAVE